jgi:hypothetical protein
LQDLDENIVWTEPVELEAGARFTAMKASGPISPIHARVRLEGSEHWNDTRLADVFTFDNGRAIQMKAFADRRQALEFVGISATDVPLERSTANKPAIARIWRGRVKRERADEYQKYNYEFGIKPLIEKAMGVQALREDRDTETEFIKTEFITISYWESIQAMSRFTGGDPSQIHDLERDVEFLIEIPKSVQILRIYESHGRIG